MENKFEIKKTFPVDPSTLYEAWLNSESHTDMTGGAATISPQENEPFSAWDGYISGRNIKLIKDREINQSWRTTEFGSDDDDSELTLKLEATDGGTILTLIHSNIPDGQPDYKQGWEDHYFSPMTDYFK